MIDWSDPECVFCRICEGHESTVVLKRWSDAVVFEPLNPVTPGHLLVVPRFHVADFAEAPDVSARVMRRAAQLAADLGGSFNLITSKGREATQTILHLHLHLVPRRPGDELMLPWS